MQTPPQEAKADTPTKGTAANQGTPTSGSTTPFHTPLNTPIKTPSFKESQQNIKKQEEDSDSSEETEVVFKRQQMQAP